MKTLVLGGARSGKSQHAECLARETGKKLVYVATAQVFDQEMEARVALHKARRDEQWTLVESPTELHETLTRISSQDTCVLVDCLTLWLTNHLLDDSLNQAINQTVAALVQQLQDLPGDTIFVSNEVGWGIVPMGELSRRFQDEAGRMNQQFAAACDQVILTVAGIPMTIKS
ncbi:MAG: bifunctional adenosylcobinamide kinase/adenosylcobinamide-phosphate guanylyltransferase [Pontibacterium sp.]